MSCILHMYVTVQHLLRVFKDQNLCLGFMHYMFTIVRKIWRYQGDNQIP